MIIKIIVDIDVFVVVVIKNPCKKMVQYKDHSAEFAKLGHLGSGPCGINMTPESFFLMPFFYSALLTRCTK